MAYKLLVVLLLALAGCGQAAPTSAPASTSDQAAATPDRPLRRPAPTNDGAVRVRVTGQAALDDDGAARVCPGSAEQCAGVTVTGQHAAAVADVVGQGGVVVEIDGWYDGADLEAEGPPTVRPPEDFDELFATPCAGVGRTPNPDPTEGEEVNSPPDAFAEIARWARQNPDRYAMSWWDRSRYTINVLLTDDRTDEVTEVLKTRLTGRGVDETGRAVALCVTGGADYSERQIEQASNRLHDAVNSLSRDYGIDGWSGNPRMGTIDVTASQMDRQTNDALTAAAGVPVEVQAFLTVLDGTVDDLPPYRGGHAGSVPLDTATSRGGAGMDALGGFTVHYDEQLGCVYLDGGGGRREAALWPFGYTADADPLRIYDAEGNVVLREGDSFEVGGGSVPAPSLQHRCGADEGDDAWIMNGAPEAIGK